MKKFLLLLIPCAMFAATEPMNVNTGDGKVKETSSGVGSVTLPFDFSDVTVTGLPGGGGGVSTFSAGNLSPLFTTSVANPTTAPALSFTLSTVAAQTVYGNNTGSTATPGFSSAPQFLKIGNLTANGFVKTSGGDGTLSVDTSTYLTNNQTITLSGDLSGSGTTSIAATIANDAVTFAKFQNITSGRNLGRRTSGTGNVEELFPLVTINVKDPPYNATGDGATDDTTAIQTAITDVFNAGGGTIFFPKGTYLVNGAFDGTTNSVLKIPMNASTNASIAIQFVGEMQAPWMNNVITSSLPAGVVIKSTKTGSGTRPAILAGAAYMASPGVTDFNAVFLSIKGMTFRTYDNPTIGALRLQRVSRVSLEDVAVDTGTTNPSEPTGGTVGVEMPSTGNYAVNECNRVTIQGYDRGLQTGEHFTSGYTLIAYCNVGIEFTGGNDQNAVGNLCLIWSKTFIRFIGNGSVDLNVDFERAAAGNWFSTDTNKDVDGVVGFNYPRGTIRYSLSDDTGPIAGPLGLTAPGDMVFINLFNGSLQWNGDLGLKRGTSTALHLTDSTTGFRDLKLRGAEFTGTIVFPDDIRQTFNPGATVAGLNVGGHAGDPSTPTNGDLWYDSTANELTARINGANVALGAGGGGSFLSLSDTPNSYTGEALKVVRVNAGETALEFATATGGGTVTHTGGALTSNAVVLGAGADDVKVVTGITTDGTSKLTLGVAGTSVGSIDLKNATSGTITITPTTGALGTVSMTLPAANSNPVIPDTGAANNFLTAISSGGVISKAQPAFSNLSGDYALTQTPSLAADKLVGRGNGGGAGDWEAITLGTGLSMTGTTLNVTAGGGNVSNTGTPVDNQVAIWTTATTIEGDTDFTFDGTTLSVGPANFNLLSSGKARFISNSGSDSFIVSPFGNGVHTINATFDGADWRYDKNGFAASVQLSGSDGNIIFNKSSSGTAGNVITFTPSLTLEQDGDGVFSANVSAATNFIPDANDGAGLGTTALQFSDLFLAEGAVINWDNGDATLTQTGNSIALAGADLTLGESTSVQLDGTLTDGTWTGTTITGTSGAAQSFGDLVVLDDTNSRWELADANVAALAEGDARAMIGIVVVAGSDGAACTVLLQGTVRANTAFPTFTVGQPVYVSETAGDVTNTQPTTADVVIRVVGYGIENTDTLYFNPSGTWTTHL